MLARIILAAALASGVGNAAQAFDLIPGAPPAVVVTRDVAGGPVVFRSDLEVAPASCPSAGAARARLYFTFVDPQGIDYAGVDIGAGEARPVMSSYEAASRWIAPELRELTAYRYRLEADRPLRTRRTIPVNLVLAPGGEPLDIHIEAKDGAGNLAILDFELDPVGALCR